MEGRLVATAMESKPKASRIMGPSAGKGVSRSRGGAAALCGAGRGAWVRAGAAREGSKAAAGKDQR